MVEQQSQNEQLSNNESRLPLEDEKIVHYVGRLEFFSETGTEGGNWALQDERFINKVSPLYGVFGNQTVYDAENPQRKGKTQADAEVLHDEVWDPLPDPVQKDPDYIRSSLFRGEVNGDKEADQRLMDKFGFSMKYSAEWMDEKYGKGNWHLESSMIAVASNGARHSIGGTPLTTPHRPYGLRQGDITRNKVEWEDGKVEERLSTTLLQEEWSYEGLHFLNNGDKLTIYDKDDLNKVLWEGEISLKEFDVFTESALGFWIHDEQVGVDRNRWAAWFLKSHPAKLTSIKKVNAQQNQE